MFYELEQETTWGADDGVSRISGKFSPAWMRITSTMSFFVLKNTNNYLFFWFYFKNPKPVFYKITSQTYILQVWFICILHTHLYFCSGKSHKLQRRPILSKFCERKYLHGCRLTSKITDSSLPWQEMSREGRKDKELTDSDWIQSVKTLSPNSQQFHTFEDFSS